MPTLATTVDGLKMPNPFVIGSGPPGTNLNVISRAFKEGWGAVMGQDPDILEEVCGWVKSATNKAVWAKMTPNITHIEDPSRAALKGGATGLSAINTIRSVVGVNLDTLRPEPSVEGYTTPGGYSCKAVKPIALRMVMEIATMIRKEFAGRSLSGLGGIESGNDAQ